MSKRIKPIKRLAATDLAPSNPLNTLLSGYRIMWLLVMFDLPTLTKTERKNAQAFRLSLLDQGFEMAQLSVYMRVCGSKAHYLSLLNKIQLALPEGGKVDVLCFTDKQYGQIRSFRGGQRQRLAKPDQLMLF
jgi:CRISPR-associated protein Cas2